MEVMNRRNFIDDIFNEDYTRINGYGDLEVQKDLARAKDKKSIVLAVNKSKKEIKSEITAITLGTIITGLLAIPEVESIIKLIESKQADLPTNGTIIGGVAIIVICGFVVKRIFELVGLARFKTLATNYLEKDQPRYAPDLYKTKKISL